jgi:hypothetical protein
MKRIIGKLTLVTLFFASFLSANPPPTHEKDWTTSFGSETNDFANAICSDEKSNIYIAGSSYGSFEGSNEGLTDIILAKYNKDGKQLWVKQIGSDNHDSAQGIDIDSQGNIYIIGYTLGEYLGLSYGGYDIVLIKYNSEGVFQWWRQIGSAENDYGYDIVIDPYDRIYITGDTYGEINVVANAHNAGGSDIFFGRYNTDGVKQYLYQIGTSATDYARAIAYSLGYIYIGGSTAGNLGANNQGGYDIFLMKTEALAPQVTPMVMYGGEEDDRLSDLQVDNSGNIYVTGRTFSNFEGFTNAGGSDTFLIKYYDTLLRAWMKQFGTAGDDYSTALSIDMQNNIYVAGRSNGNWQNAGDNDGFVTQYAPNGSSVWSQYFKGTENDSVKSMIVDKRNHLYVAGETFSNLDDNQIVGFGDIFIGKLKNIKNGVFLQTDIDNAIIKGNEEGEAHCQNHPEACGIEPTLPEWSSTPLSEILEDTAGNSYEVKGYYIYYKQHSWIYVNNNANSVGKLEEGSKENGALRWTTVHSTNVPNYSSITISEDGKSIRFGEVSQ